MKFNKGDILRFKGETSINVKAGATAICQGYDNERWLRIKWIRNALSGVQMDGGYREESFELLESKPKVIQKYGIALFMESINKR